MKTDKRDMMAWGLHCLKLSLEGPACTSWIQSGHELCSSAAFKPPPPPVSAGDAEPSGAQYSPLRDTAIYRLVSLAEDVKTA